MRELLFLERNYKSLTSMIYQLEQQILQGQIGSMKVVFRYKFYTFLIFSLYQLRKNHGADIYSALLFSKKVAQRDFIYQKQLNVVFWGGIWQMIIISVILHLFFFYLSTILSWSHVSYVLVITHSIAIGLFVVCYQLWQRYLFKDTAVLFAYILEIRAFSQSGIDCFKLLNRFSANVVQRVIKSEKSSLALLLGELNLQIKDRGRPTITVMDHLQDEVDFRYQLQRKKFMKIMEVTKFLLLAIFFLGSYLYYLQHIFFSMQSLAL